MEDVKNITKNKINLEKIQPNLMLIVTILVMSMYTGHFVRSYIFKDTNEVTPYKTVFAKDFEIK